MSGKNIVYFDLETQRSFGDVGGAAHKDKMGISVAVTYSTARGGYRIYGEGEVNELVAELVRADLVVGWNHVEFDYPVLQGYTVYDLPAQTVNLDMMLDLQDKLGFRLKLDAAASASLGTGKHTTTHARLYHLDARSELIDTPGVQAFGVHHLGFEDLAGAFIEFRPLLGQCRFRDCRHLAEPGCALVAAEDGRAVDRHRDDAGRAASGDRQGGRRAGQAARPQAPGGDPGKLRMRLRVLVVDDYVQSAEAILADVEAFAANNAAMRAILERFMP